MGQSRQLVAGTVLVTILGMLTACGGGGGSGSAANNTGSSGTGGIAQPAKPLEVTATLPTELTIDVDPGKPINLTFGAPLDTSAFRSDQVQLSDGSKNVPITATASGQLVTVTPTARLQQRTTYRLTVKAGMKGADGSVLKNDFALNFRTVVTEYDIVTLAPSTVFSRAGNSHIKIADINGDGRADLVEMTPIYKTSNLQRVQGYQLNIYRQNAAKQMENVQQLEFAVSESSYAVYFNSLIVLDIDNDSKPELLVPQYSVSNETPSGIRVFKSGPDGKFAAQEFIATGFTDTLQAVDIDGDEKTDLLGSRRANTSDGSLAGFQVLLRTATGFTAMAPVALQNGLRQPAVADFDQDGKRDVIVHYLRQDPPSARPVDELHIYSQGERGVFSLNPALTGETTDFCTEASSCEDMQVVNWNGDGKPVLFFNSYSLTEVKRNQMLSFTRKPGGGLVRELKLVDDYSRVIAIQDMDGDGVVDLLAVGSVPGEFNFFSVSGGNRDFSVHLSKINRFQADTIVPSTIAVGDIDGDGRTDIVFDTVYNGILMARSVK